MDVVCINFNTMTLCVCVIVNMTVQSTRYVWGLFRQDYYNGTCDICYYISCDPVYWVLELIAFQQQTAGTYFPLCLLYTFEVLGSVNWFFELEEATGV